MMLESAPVMMSEKRRPAQSTGEIIITTPQEVTALLQNWQRGDRSALDELTPLVFDELRRIAHRYMQHERNGHTLQTTALINEAYLRLAGGQPIEWQNRAHFFGVIAQVMRHVLT